MLEIIIFFSKLSCTCLYPYSGVNCNTNIACAINPCFNYGTCVGQNIVPFFSCICPTGVNGQRFETKYLIFVSQNNKKYFIDILLY
jgi:hypothetical protein